MLLLPFRQSVETAVRLALFGAVVAAPTGTMLSQYSLDPNALRAGEKGFQIRVWQQQFDVIGSNDSGEVAGVEIEVHRKMLVEEDEALYITGGEMLADMERLLTKSLWVDLTEAHSYFEGSLPVIGSAPDRTDQVLSYEVTFEMQLNPS